MSCASSAPHGATTTALMPEPGTGKEPVPAPVAAVLFDLDGVLIDSLEIMRAAYAEAVDGLTGLDP